jgi:chitinase
VSGRYDRESSLTVSQPGTQGTGCNQVDEANDIENYILFLQELRCKVGKRVRISSAVPAAGYAAFKDGQSKRLAAALTDILIMTYDFNGERGPPQKEVPKKQSKV